MSVLPCSNDVKGTNKVITGNYSKEFEGYVNLDEFGEYDIEEENSLRVIKK